MDAEIAAAIATVTSALISGGVVAILKQPEDVVLVGRTQTVDSSHVHEGAYAKAGGWFCECGKHLHIHSFPKGDKFVCACGHQGVGKEWA